MIVQCPSCASRYRVNEANIPSTGGRIRCPSCEHAFVVYPEPEPSFEDDADDKTSVIMSPNLQEMMANHQNSFKSKPVPAAVHEEEEESMTEVMDPSDIPSLSGPGTGGFGHQSEPIADDNTVEMASPAGLALNLRGLRNSAHNARDDGQTTELSADALKKGLQAAAAARNLASKSGASAPPPMPGPPLPTTRPPRPSVSQGLPAVPRSLQATPHAAPQTIQKTGQRPAGQPAFKPSTIEPQNKQDMRFPSEPVGGRSFGEEPADDATMVVPSSFAPQTGQAAPNMPEMPAGLSDTDDTGVSMMAPVMVSSAPAPAHPDADHVGPWHLRTNFGLTYEFPDTKGLRSWLSNRDELDGVTLSADGNEFFELNHFPQVRANALTGALPAVNAAAGPGFGSSGLNAPPTAGFGGPQRLTSTPFSTADGHDAASGAGFGADMHGAAAPIPDPSSRITPEVYRPGSGRSKMGLLLWPVLIVLIVFALALVLQTLKIVDFKSMIFGADETGSGDAVVAQVDTNQANAVDPEEALREQEAERAREARKRDQLERIILTAEEDIEDNRLQIASEKLSTALALDPDNIRIHEMLVDVYSRLGQPKLAEEASEALEKVRGKSLPPSDE